MMPMIRCYLVGDVVCFTCFYREEWRDLQVNVVSTKQGSSSNRGQTLDPLSTISPLVL